MTLVEAVDRRLEVFDLPSNVFAGRDRLSGVRPRALGLSHPRGELIPAPFELLDLGNGDSSTLIHIEKLVEQLGRTAMLQTCFDCVEITPEKVQIQHERPV